jgi:hypothetical protein
MSGGAREMREMGKRRKIRQMYWVHQLRTVFARQLFYSLPSLCLYPASEVGVNRRYGAFTRVDFSASFSTRHPGVQKAW